MTGNSKEIEQSSPPTLPWKKGEREKEKDETFQLPWPAAALTFISPSSSSFKGTPPLPPSLDREAEPTSKGNFSLSLYLHT